MKSYIWSHNKSGVYSSKSGYHWLLSHLDSDTLANAPWNWIWKLKVPEKYKFLVWLACHNAAPTLTLLNHRNIINSATCFRCGEHEESFLHCVRDCRFSKSIWQQVGFSSQAFFTSLSATDWLKEGANCSRSTIFLAGLWWIWRHRNLMCFNNETLSPVRVSFNIINSANVISSCLLNSVSAPYHCQAYSLE